MTRSTLTLILLVLGTAAVAAYLTVFTVDQTQQALVLEFGRPKRVISEPGLNYKIPFVQNVEFFDKRILYVDTSSQEVIASDKKRLVVDAFARYRITGPLLFFQSVHDERIASARIGAVLEASLRRVLGGASFASVVRDKREALMRTILTQVNAEAAAFGVQIVDVRIKRVDLPEANMQAIYRRMQTERQREAAEWRGEGEGASRRIRATADREVTVIKADATGESERIRGAGDAEKNRIFAEAFGKDQDFFAFYRSMQAYEGALKSGDTRLLLSPNSQFFQYFNDATGKGGGEGSGGTTERQKEPLETPKASPDTRLLPEGAAASDAAAGAQPGAGPVPAPGSAASGGEPVPPAPQAQ
jgi:modulator of FtsH protease HflC